MRPMVVPDPSAHTGKQRQPEQVQGREEDSPRRGQERRRKLRWPPLPTQVLLDPKVGGVFTEMDLPNRWLF